MDFIIKRIASAITESSNFKKKLDFLYFLPLISKLQYPVALKYAKKRGEVLSEKYLNNLNDAKRNIVSILNISEKKAKNIAKNLFIKASYEELEGCLIAKKDINFLNEFVEIKGVENIEKALNKNKGIVLVIAHVGSFASALCKTAYIFKTKKFNAISWDYTTSECSVVRQFLKKKIDGMSYFFKGEYFYVGRINSKKLFNTLKNKEILIIAVDAPLGNSKFVEINFLNKKVLFPFSAVKIAYKTDSLIIPLTVYRHGLKIVGEYFAPIEIKDDNYSKYMQKIFSILEKNIFEHPDEFFYWTSPTNWMTIDKL